MHINGDSDFRVLLQFVLQVSFVTPASYWASQVFFNVMKIIILSFIYFYNKHTEIKFLDTLVDNPLETN